MEIQVFRNEKISQTMLTCIIPIIFILDWSQTNVPLVVRAKSGLVPFTGWVCCWSLFLYLESFSGCSGFLPSRRNQHFKIPVQTWIKAQQKLSPGWHGFLSSYGDSPLYLLDFLKVKPWILKSTPPHHIPYPLPITQGGLSKQNRWLIIGRKLYSLWSALCLSSVTKFQKALQGGIHLSIAGCNSKLKLELK